MQTHFGLETDRKLHLRTVELIDKQQTTKQHEDKNDSYYRCVGRLVVGQF
jgi:hypothetical protein